MTGRETVQRAVAVALLITCMGACGGREPRGKAAATPETPAPASTATAESPPTPPPTDEPALTLPAGQTLGDQLPQVPPLPLRLTTGALAGAGEPPQTGCADVLPANCGLSKRVELTLPGRKPDDPPQMAEVCLCMRGTDRADPQRAMLPGKQVVAVAVWPGDKRAEVTFDEAKHAPTSLPGARQKAGHDASAWGALVATGWDALPVVAIASARFYDGAFGEQIVWTRTAQALHVADGKLTWQPVESRTFTSLDLDHLQALCDGKAAASPADRAGPVAEACVAHDKLVEEHANAAAARLAARQKRLKGQGTEAAAGDDDPQAIWVRDAKKQLNAGKWEDAITTALRADAVCGEAVAQAHEVIAAALRDGHVQPIKTQPNQSLADLCEPLPDKSAPKRTVVQDEKPAKAVRTPGRKP